MKKILNTIPAIALIMLSSCYEGEYVLTERTLGELTTKPVKINETRKVLSLEGYAGDMSVGNLYFQLDRTRDFATGQALSIYYEEAQEMPLGMLADTYYYRLYTELNGDTVYAKNVESFNVDNILSISSVKPSDDITYHLVCTSNYEQPTFFRVSTDQSFNDYEDYYANETWHNEDLTAFEYSAKLEKLSRGTTYYVKAMREVILGTVESDVESFTTTDFLKMGEVTYTGWDGKTYPMTEGYDHFFANYLVNSQTIGSNIEVYRTENSWELAKEIKPYGNGVLYGFFSYDTQNSDNVIEIQTYKYDNPILMWGAAEEDNGIFNLNMRNMLSRVVFHSTVSDDYPVGKPECTEFTITGHTLPTIANFQVNTGTFAYNQWSFSSPLGYRNKIDLSKGETVDLVLYSIPTSDPGAATVSMSFMDNKFDSDIEIDWKSGNTYEYNLTVTAAGLSISDVIVNEWQPTEGGSITINPKK